VAGGGTAQGVLALANPHGDVLGQYTATGTSVAGSQAYDPWGSVTAASGTFSGLLGYQSGWSDTAAGKTLMGARWYDPAAGDFTSADTVQVNPVPDPAAGSPFAYAGDEPLDNTDPTGHMILDDNGREDLAATRAAAAAYRASVARAAPRPVLDAHQLHLAHLAHLGQTAAKPAVRRKATTALKPADKPVLSKQLLDSVLGNLGTSIKAGSRAKALTKKIDGWSNAANNLALSTSWIPVVDEGTGLAADFFQGMKGGNAIANGNIAGGIGDLANGIFMGAGGTILKGIGKLGSKAAAPVLRAVARNGAPEEQGLADLAAWRKSLGLPPPGPKVQTLGRLDIDGRSFYGISSHGQAIDLNVNAISRTHAEADAFQQAKNAGVTGKTATWYVDYPGGLCKSCGQFGGLRSMARQLGLKEVTVVYPGGTFPVPVG
jgi:RHS repeat-associated protein